MNFSYDIYVSYALADNETNWVNNFSSFLKKTVTQMLGQEPQMLVYANQEKPSQTTLSQTALMVAVLSPHYASSVACIEEIEDFLEQDPQKGVERIFKVVKLPVKPEQQPSKIRDLLSHNFFKVNESGDEITQFEDFFNEEAEEGFWSSLIDLAYDICQSLQEIKNIESDIFETEQSGKVVYLAETSPDLYAERAVVKRELQKFGYQVLPSKSLPINVQELELNVRKDLERCQMSIHLIGNSYGDPLDELGVSVMDLQNRLAAEHAQMAIATEGSLYDNQTGFNRVIWVAPDAKFITEKQRVFVDNLRQSAEALEGADFLQVALQDLKGSIRKKLNESQQDLEHNSQGDLKSKAVYLMYDQADETNIVSLEEYLHSKGYEVLKPKFDGNLLEVRKVHISNLVQAQYALVYYGNIGKQWVAMKILDLLKAPGLGKSKPFKGKAIVTAQDFQTDSFMQKNNIEVIEIQINAGFGNVGNFLAKS